MPTRAEALGLVFCEALGAGVPSLGTATGGVPDAITEGVTGFLIGRDELPRDTARRMLEAGEQSRYLTMVEACWRQWSERFATEAVSKKLTRLLEAAASSGNVAMPPSRRTDD